MKHLILGSAGQIGQYLVRHIKSQDNETVIEWDNVYDQGQDLRYKNSELESAIREVDFVHFLAFDVGGSRYLQRYQHTFDFIHNNVKIMENVFSLLKKYPTPFYFASSQMSNMYNSNYGRLKSVGESYTTALDGLNLHFWNVYGYENNPEKSHVITDFIKMALKDQRILVHTTGEEERAFTYAADAARIMYKVSQKHDAFKTKEIENSLFDTSNLIDGPLPVSVDSWTSIKTLAYIVASVMQKYLDQDISLYFGDAKDSIQGYKNPFPHYYNQFYRIIEFDSYRDFVDLHDGVELVLKEILANE